MPVTLVATGGTIASVSAGDGTAAPELTGEDLAEAVPGLDALPPLEVVEFSNVPSAHFTVQQCGALVSLVRSLDSDPDVQGVIVTQGTDVLEESAYFVDRCYGGTTPVVFTGAMRPPDAPSPDGPVNLLGSVRAALAARSEDLGTLVCLNDRIHAAREVAKTHSMNPDAFRSPEFGPLGTIDEGRVSWRRRPWRRGPTLEPAVDRLTGNVHAVVATMDMPGTQIEAATGADGLCLAATGAGHVPPGIVPALESVVGAGVPLVVTTRCAEGRLARETYGFEGSEATLRDLDAYFSDRSLPKTRIDTILALAADALDEVFDRP